MAAPGVPGAKPTRHYFTHMGGETFSVISEPSDNRVLQGAVFGEKERRFLREQLSNECVCFAIRDTYRVWIRTLWQHSCQKPSAEQSQKEKALLNSLAPGAMPAPPTGLHGEQAGPGFAHKRHGKFVICLHDMNADSGLTSSWVFAKFLRSFFRKGLSVIMVDLPGFGKSTLSQRASCDPKQWAQFQSHLLTKIVEELGITECHVVACGESAGILLRALQRVPHRLELTHFLINPVFDKDDIFPVDMAKLRSKVGDDWHAQKLYEQQQQLEELIRTRGTRLWCLCEERNTTFEFLKRSALNHLLAHQIAVTEISREDVSSAQASAEVPGVRVLVPSRHLKQSVAAFLVGTGPPGQGFVPARKQNQAAGMLHAMQASSGRGANGWGGAETWRGEDDEDEPDTRPDSRSTISLSQSGSRLDSRSSNRPGSRFDSRPDSSSRPEGRNRMSSSLSKLDKPPQWKASSMLDTPDKRGAWDKGPSGLQMEVSLADQAALRPLRPPHLGRSAKLARERLAASDSRLKLASAGSQGTGQHIDWEKAPFEAELSYAVRKQMQDALDASRADHARVQRARLQEELAENNRMAALKKRSTMANTMRGAKGFDNL